jgi:hypothetical protein
MYYHGTSTACNINFKLLPPEETNVLQEKGRKKNLGRVFFTEDLGLARVYAGRAVKRFGGTPVVFRVIPMGDIECLSEKKGASVYHSKWAFVEKI